MSVLQLTGPARNEVSNGMAEPSGPVFVAECLSSVCSEKVWVATLQLMYETRVCTKRRRKRQKRRNARRRRRGCDVMWSTFAPHRSFPMPTSRKSALSNILTLWLSNRVNVVGLNQGASSIPVPPPPHPPRSCSRESSRRSPWHDISLASP